MDPNFPADEIVLPATPDKPPVTLSQPFEEPGAMLAVEPASGETENLPPPEGESRTGENPAAGDRTMNSTSELGEQAPADPLAELADRALRSRLSPADEERTIALIKEASLEGRKGVERVVEQLPKLPWVVGVSGVTAAWPEMKTTFRARLIGGLAKTDTEATRRVRLSLARGLFKQDVTAAMKLAVGVAREIRDKETGAVHPKNAQIFANVLIGRAKPWIAQIVLADLKPADADLLVHCALVSVFGIPHAPVTQLGVLKWAAAADRLGKVHPLALAPVLESLSRWSGKWQAALRKEAPQLPEEIAGVLGASSAPPSAPAKPEASEDAEPIETSDDRLENEPSDMEGSAQAPQGHGEDRPERAREEDEDDDERADSEEGRDEASGQGWRRREAESQPRQPLRPRPVYESKTVPSLHQRRQIAPGNFNLGETLRQIESHVAALRSELHLTQSKLRQREDELRKPRRGALERPPGGAIVHGEPSLEELARLNRQLEARNTELQAHIQELATDSEDRAAAASSSGPEVAIAPDAQLRALLSLKLQEDYEDFAALEKEAPDIVVQQHYRTVLRHVFAVLQSEGVPLAESPASKP